jgi:hypothetical protein
MTETLLTPSSIKLFGRVISSLSFTNDTADFGGNYFLQRQLSVNTVVNTQGDTTAYAYGPVPPVYPLQPGVDPWLIVQNIPPGDIINLRTGMLISDPHPPMPPVILPNTVIIAINGANDPYFPYSIFISRPAQVGNLAYPLVATLSPTFARIYAFSFEGAYFQMPRPTILLVHGPGQPVGNWGNPSTLDQSGVMGREWDFSGNSYNGSTNFGDGFATDISYWEYEKGDFSMRVDLDSGPFEQILLQMALRTGADRADRSGMGVSGMGVSGMGVSGMGVSGMGVSGMGLRNGR